jgi:hypothetical protein
MKHCLALLLCTFLISSSALAIVNIESLRFKEQKQPTSAKLALSGQRKEGNSNTEELSTAGQFRRIFADSEHLSLLKYKYGESQNLKNADELLLHYRYVLKPQEFLAREFYLQYSRNDFTRLAFRNLAGLGLRLRSFDGEGLRVYTGLGAFYSQEKLKNSAGTTDSGTSEFTRVNLYVSLQYTVTKSLKLQSVTYFQPVVTDLVDYRLYQDLDLEILLGTGFSVSLSYLQRHDNLPPQGVRKTDHNYGTVLRWSYN